MIYTTFNDFLKSFNIPDKIERSEYKSKLKMLASHGEKYEDAKLFVEWAKQSDEWTDKEIADI